MTATSAQQATAQPQPNATQPSQGVPVGAATAQRPWPILKSWSTWVAKILLAIAGIFATYVALSVAIWTSIKDYRDDCRSQNVSW